ncbi:unnamed protein product [Linum trigynum]|uniref:Myb-like domain-containing protein n=1 Tax=Linum trigynum TaxID=586398 RepID=A0AAV2CJQ0_9ROSI
MFEGVAPEQFHPFILATTSNPSTTTTTLHPPPPPPPPPPPSSLSPSPHLPLHLSFASPHPSSPSPSPAAVFPIGFDPYQLPHPPNFFHPLNHTANSTRSNVKNHHEDRELMPTFVIPHHHHHHQQQQQQKIITEHPQAWSNEEVLALLRIRSTMELNWFPPEFTWEHVSRKLSEVGFKRSPEKCREKFEEETRFLNSIHGTNNHSYFPNHDENGCINQQQQNKYAHDNAEVEHESKPGTAPIAGNQAENEHQDRPTVESNEDDTEEEEEGEDYAAPSAASNGNQKRKRRQEEEEEEEEEKFEMFKGLCQEMVDKMMAQQEEMQNKLIEDMVRRDREKLAREEAWKQREMDRINHELQLRADQQALAGDRQASIIKFLENFTTTTAALTNAVTNSAPPPPLGMIDYQIQIATAGDKDGNSNRNSTSSSSSAANPNNNSSADELSQLEPGAVTGVGSKSIPPNSSRNPRKSGESEENRGRSSVKEEVGKRWPRDEVLALINLRCGIHNHNNTEGEGTPTAAAGSNSKAPLWERISRGMAELGYRRSAKRCKEKWENINKYFRKTKDLNKKRSADSRTCPYFHQLSTLYGAAAAAAAVPKPSASEEEEQVVEGTKEGTDSENNINTSIAASDGTSAAAEIVAPAAAAAASFGYEF